LPLQIGAGDIIEKQRRRSSAPLEVTPEESLFDGLLAGTEIIQRRIGIVLIERAQTQPFAEGLFLLLSLSFD
jgi:hypothetical protein